MRCGERGSRLRGRCWLTDCGRFTWRKINGSSGWWSRERWGGCAGRSNGSHKGGFWGRRRGIDRGRRLLRNVDRRRRRRLAAGRRNHEQQDCGCYQSQPFRWAFIAGQNSQMTSVFSAGSSVSAFVKSYCNLFVLCSLPGRGYNSPVSCHLGTRAARDALSEDTDGI